MTISDVRLRLLTLNTQLMYVPVVHSKDGVMQAARRLASSLEYDQWADVLCLNEVFDEDCRAHLVSALQPHWPHVAERFGPVRSLTPSDTTRIASAFAAWLATGYPASVLAELSLDKLADWLRDEMGVPEDSGLMVFSRYPIVDSGFESYTEGTDVDWLADKGVAHVVIERSPDCEAHIFLTHTQASYAVSAEQHSGERASQLRQAAEFIMARAPLDSDRRRIISAFCGDLNVHGDEVPRPEWERIFVQGQAHPFYADEAHDAWEHYISRAGGRVSDPGITNRGEGRSSRLDYVILRDSPPMEQPALVVQRMELAQQGVSDHIGVRAEINLRTPHCYPADALPIKSGVGNHSLNLAYAGVCWLYFAEGGTWSFAGDTGDETDFRIVSTHDVSHELGPRRYTDLAAIKHAAGALRFENADRQARTYEIPGDFLVMIRRRKDTPGPVSLGWFRHLGTSPDDAILVRPQYQPKGPNFAALAAANVHGAMEFWFDAEFLSTRSNDPVTWRFLLHNPTGEPLDLRVIDKSTNAVIASTQDTEFITELKVQSTVPRTVQAVVTLSNPLQTGFALELRSPLNFLIDNGGRRLELFCINETGVDIVGNDEISLTMRPDQAGGDIGLLSETTGVYTGRSIPLSPATGNWTPGETGFRHNLEITITEIEIIADDVDTGLVAAMPDASYHEERSLTLKPGTGEYRIDLIVAREPSDQYWPFN